MNKTTFLLLPGYMVMVLFFIFSLLGLISCIFGFLEMSRDPLPTWVIEESPDEGYTCWRHRSSRQVVCRDYFVSELEC